MCMDCPLDPLQSILQLAELITHPLLPDDRIALFQAHADLDLGRGLDSDRDRRATRAVALTDFDEPAALERPDRRRWQPQPLLPQTLTCPEAR